MKLSKILCGTAVMALLGIVFCGGLLAYTDKEAEIANMEAIRAEKAEMQLRKANTVSDGTVRILATNYSNDGRSGNSETDPYIIDSFDDLDQLRRNVDNGSEPYGKYYRLDADITISGFWGGIGYLNSFTGHFDGNNRTITYNNVTGNELFINVEVSGVAIKDLNVTGGISVLNRWVGGIVNMLYSGTISNCTFAGTANATKWVGGIVAQITGGSIVNCKTSPQAVLKASEHAGGIVEYVRTTGSISRCTSNAELVSATTGGIVGCTAPDSTVSLYGNTWTNAYKEVGKNSGSISRPSTDPTWGDISGDVAPKQDNDKDGLDDNDEIHGMRDLYGAVWKTDPNEKDTDGDGIKDGDEIKPTIFFYYIRESNPLLKTVSSDNAYITIADRMLAVNDIEGKCVEVTINITDWRYREEETHEIFFDQVKNLTVQLDVPEHFTIQKQPYLVRTETVNERDQSKKMTYKAILSYSGNIVPVISFLKWKINADNIEEQKPIERLLPIDFHTLQIRSALLDEADKAVSNVANDFIKAIIGGMEEKAADAEDQLKEIKEIIKPTPSGAPDEVYEALALGIVEALVETKIDGYESDSTKLTNQLIKQIRKTTQPIEATVIVDGTSYYIYGTIISNSNLFVVDVKVTSGSKTFKILSTNYGSKIGEQALAKYCAAIAQLNTDVWKDFLAYLVTDLARELSFGKITYKTVRKNLDRAELIIKALCDKKYADELIQEFGEEAKEYLKSKFLSPANKNIVNFLEGMMPDLSGVLKQAGNLKSTIEKYRAFERKISEYQDIADKEGVEKATEQTQVAFNEFYSLYNSLKGIDIFENFKPISEWPKNWK